MNNIGSDTKDKVATAVLPVVWGSNVVAVVQFTAPHVDPLGVFYDATNISPSGHLPPASSVTLEQRNKAIKHMSATIRDLLDFSEVNADQEFAASFSHDAGVPTQTMLGRARTLRGQMMYQLLQLCLELRLDEEKCVGLIALVSTIAEVFGRHFPPHQASLRGAGVEDLGQTLLSRLTHRNSAAGASASYLGSPGSALQLMRSPRREDVSLTAAASRVDLNGSLVGLAHFFNLTSEELQHADDMQHNLTEETHNLHVIVERLKKSRAKYLQRSEDLQKELNSSQESLEVEKQSVKKLSHAIRKAEARLKAYEQQQMEIGKLNSIMRTAAHVALQKPH